MLNLIGIWGVWERNQHLRLFFMFLEPFLISFCIELECIYLNGKVTDVGEACCRAAHNTLVDHMSHSKNVDAETRGLAVEHCIVVRSPVLLIRTLLHF